MARNLIMPYFERFRTVKRSRLAVPYRNPEQRERWARFLWALEPARGCFNRRDPWRCTLELMTENGEPVPFHLLDADLLDWERPPENYGNMYDLFGRMDPQEANRIFGPGPRRMWEPPPDYREQAQRIFG